MYLAPIWPGYIPALVEERSRPLFHINGVTSFIMVPWKSLLCGRRCPIFSLGSTSQRLNAFSTVRAAPATESLFVQKAATYVTSYAIYHIRIQRLIVCRLLFCSVFLYIFFGSVFSSWTLFLALLIHNVRFWLTHE